jgi:hypothetical protein
VTPSVAEVVACYERALADGMAPPHQDGVLGLLLELLRNNFDQWQREDATRVPDASDAVVAAAKRDIDTLNTRRHRLVEAIDAAIAAAIEQDPTAPPATESPAMVFDRLAVLTIRIHFTARARGGGYADRLPLLRDQLELGQEALEALFDDIRAGRKRFVPYQSLKLYGSP